jgi:maleate isomerase
VRGNTFDDEFAAEMQKQTGIATVTTAASAVQALAYLGAKKVVVATPYTNDLNEIERAFLNYQGFEVITIKGMGLTDPDQIRETTAGAVYRFSRELWAPEADALFFSCTGVPTFEVIELLEKDIGSPVISSNQATLWHMLRTAGVSTPIAGLGRLFAGQL